MHGTATGGMGVIADILEDLDLDGPVEDIRVGALWTVVTVSTPHGLRAGLASTQILHDLEHGRPAVRDAGRLVGMQGRALAALALSDSLTERSIGFAALNALLTVDKAACVDVNAEEIIVNRLVRIPGRAAIIGHFPFVPRVREYARECWVLELNPREGDLPADQAPYVLPLADVVAITGMALVNGTFESLVGLCRPDAYVLLLGATTPLSDRFFLHGVRAVSGAILTDIPAAVAAVSQGANFRQIPGKRLVTMSTGGAG